MDDSDSDWTAIDMAEVMLNAAGADHAVSLRRVLDKFHKMATELEQTIRSNHPAAKPDLFGQSSVNPLEDGMTTQVRK